MKSKMGLKCIHDNPSKETYKILMEYFVTNSKREYQSVAQAIYRDVCRIENDDINRH